MSYARHNRDLKKLTPGDRLGAALNAKRLNALADLAQAAAMGQNVRGGPGVRVRSGPGGVTITSTVRGGRGGGRTLMPLECRVASRGETNTEVKVISGTVLGEVPTIDGDPLDDTDPPLLTIPNSGTRHICLNFRLEHTAAGGFVYPIITFPGTGSKVSVTAETTEPGAGAMQGTGGNATVVEYQTLLATFVNGVRTVQAGYGAITGELCDTLEGTNTAILNLTWGGVP